MHLRSIVVAMLAGLGLLMAPVASAEDVEDGELCSAALGVCVAPGPIAEPRDIEEVLEQLIGPCTCPPRDAPW